VDLKSTGIDPRRSGLIEKFIQTQVNEMIDQAGQGLKPLVRLKIDHTGFPVVKSLELNSIFAEKIANPSDFL
jgi:hypothetical protein